MARRRLVVYLTFGDHPSGVFKSQVEDVVNFIREELDQDIRLIAFISIRRFFRNRKQIMRNVPGAFIVPMVPRIKNWRCNRLVLYALVYFLKPRVIFSRGIFATVLASKCREKGIVETVVYDGRGAIAAEWREYTIADNLTIKNYIHELEKRVVLESDGQLAVSKKLVEYWRSEFGYNSDRFRIIPSTLNRKLWFNGISGFDSLERRGALGIKADDVVLVYSGSSADWQSHSLMLDFVQKLMTRQENIVLLFLCKESHYIKKLTEIFFERIKRCLVRPEDVPHYLEMCDYGLLIRENTITNRVAAPVKFAEYLASGLKLIISDGIGDYSSMVREMHVGFLADEELDSLKPLSTQDRCQSRDVALKYFSKTAYANSYLDLINPSSGQ